MYKSSFCMSDKYNSFFNWTLLICWYNLSLHVTLCSCSTDRPEGDGKRGSEQEEPLGAECLLRSGKRVFSFCRSWHQHPRVHGYVRCSDLAWGKGLPWAWHWLILKMCCKCDKNFIFVGNSFVPVLGEQPATSEPDGQSSTWDWSWDWLSFYCSKSAW